MSEKDGTCETCAGWEREKKYNGQETGFGYCTGEGMDYIMTNDETITTAKEFGCKFWRRKQ